jgi:glycosyltransferase involved in cell wall biosynthesis
MQMMAGARHGGAETFFVDMIAALARRGVVQFALTRPHGERLRMLGALGCDVATARFGPPFDLITRYRAVRRADRFKPDVVLAWMSRAAAFMPSGDFVRIGRLGGYYNLKYFRRCDALICNTADIRDYAIAGGWVGECVAHIPNFSPALDSPAVARASLDTPPGVPVMLVLARLERSKGIDLAIAALAELPDIILWIAGEGTERAALERRALAAGVAGRVRFLGWRDDRSALLRAADVCVVASREEPFGNVVVNAWAHGTPLVASRSAGPSALVRDGVDGVLFDVGDHQGLAAAVRRLLSDRALASRIADAGRARAAHEFSETVIVDRYLAFMSDLVARRRGADLRVPGVRA